MEPPTKPGFPSPYIIPPSAPHTHTIILLHGLGSNGPKFGTEFLKTGISSSGQGLPPIYPGTKFIFPTSKKRRSSAFNRATFNQWFDIARLEDVNVRRDVQIQGLTESAAYITSLIVTELGEIPCENVLLGGLSQGCAMALFVLLSLDFSIGAFVGMSGWLPFRWDIEEILGSEYASAEASEDGGNDTVEFEDDNEGQEVAAPLAAINFVRDLLLLKELESDTSASEHEKLPCLETPVLLCHGEDDEKVKCESGSEAAQTLSSLGFDVTWKSYPGLGHWYKIPEGIDDILEFLRSKAGWK